ncbi:MAG TPA: glycosyltransferase [Pyrinomonadaceae bacterium]|jgi:spore maturation protein CgeB|nr:glycosyltransferase [Pyrinomonadaceae bacterium]
MTRGLNIAFFGSSLLSAYWNGAATYYRGIIRALNARGHRIKFYEPDIYDRQQHRDIADPSWAETVVYDAEGEAGVWQALEDALGADILVKTSGIGAFDELLESAILEIKLPDTLAIFWDVDAPATLDRLDQNPSDPFRRLVPLYDFIFTYGGGAPVMRAYKALGARECVPIYNALDPETHHPAPTENRFAAHLSLLANRLPDREARVDEFFLGASALLPDQKFLLGGSGWTDKAMSPNVNYLGHVFTRDHNAFNSSARAVLNVNRDSMARYGFSPPTRIFEAAGAAACLITDEWEGIDLFLEPGKEILVARDGAEVAEHSRGLTVKRARSIGAAAWRRVLSKHTYAHRAAQLEGLLAFGSNQFAWKQTASA